VPLAATRTTSPVFGESAGAKSVCLHLVSPGSRGLFNRAIVESGLCTVPGLTLSLDETQGDQYAQAMGCTDATMTLSCLRALPAQTVTSGPPNPPAQLPSAVTCVSASLADAKLATGYCARTADAFGTLASTPLAPLASKAFHSAELPYVFGDKYLLGSVPPANQPLVDAIEGYWTRFAKAGDPNGSSDPMWPAYATATDTHMGLDVTIATGTGLEKASCDFWDANSILAP
jgi:carboxylesterase type B